MERKLLERMVGGGILMIALVILGPMILDGRGSGESTDGEDIPGQRGDELRTHTFRLNQPSPANTPPPAAQVTNPASAPPPAEASSPGVQLPPPDTIPQRPTQRPSPVGRPAAGGSAAQPGVTPPAPKAAQPDAAPVGQRVASTAAAQSALDPAKQAVGGGWLVQVGTFGQKDNADRLVARLKERGFEAFVSTTVRSGKTMYRVRVGPQGTRAAADDRVGRLAAAGQAGQVVPP